MTSINFANQLQMYCYIISASKAMMLTLCSYVSLTLAEVIFTLPSLITIVISQGVNSDFIPDLYLRPGIYLSNFLPKPRPLNKVGYYISPAIIQLHFSPDNCDPLCENLTKRDKINYSLRSLFVTLLIFGLSFFLV